MDRYEALERLAKLKEQGIISDQEFILEKHAILSSPTQAGARFPPSADLSGGLHGSQQIVPQGGQRRVSTIVIVCGYITIVAGHSYIGLSLGIYILAHGSASQRKHGIVITVLASLCLLIALAALIYVCCVGVRM